MLVSDPTISRHRVQRTLTWSFISEIPQFLSWPFRKYLVCHATYGVNIIVGCPQ
jgi:hypothetical protein